jgi:prepilin peptidase CpaA
MGWLTIAGVVCLALIAATGAWLDIRYRRLPNWLCALALIAGIGFGFATTDVGAVGSSLLHSVVALAVGIGLFALGGIGAGDAKYYAALATWLPLGVAPLLIGLVGVAGLLLLLAWLPWRLKAARAGRWNTREDVFARLPYGVAISCGALASYLLTR